MRRDEEKRENSAGGSFDFALKAESIDISLAPFVQNGVAVSKAILKSRQLLYEKDIFSIDDIDFELDSNVTNIALKGEMNAQVATLHTLEIKDADLSAILALFPDKSSKTEELDKAEKEKENIFIPKRVKIDTLFVNILPFDYAPVKTKEMKLYAKELSFDVEKLLLEDAYLDFNGTSNLSNMVYRGRAHNNHLAGTIRLTPNYRLYKRYGLPLRKEAIGEVRVDFNASKEYVSANVKAEGKHIFEGKKGAFNIDVNQFVSHLSYDVNRSLLMAESKASASTPYAKDIEATNHLRVHERVEYKGEVKASKVVGFDANLTAMLDHLKISYTGDERSIHAHLDSQSLRGTFDSEDLKTAQIHAETTEAIVLSRFLKLPEEFSKAEANLTIDAPLQLSNPDTVHAKVDVASNVVNVRADVGYGKDVEIAGKVVIPEDSLLKRYSKDVKWEALTPVDARVNLSDTFLNLKLKSERFGADVIYGTKQGSVNAEIDLGGLTAEISGETKERLRIKTSIASMKALGKDISTLYNIEELPPLEGRIDATLLVDRLTTAELRLSSPKLLYRADKKSRHIIEDVNVIARMDASKVVLKSYRGTFNKQKYFSTKEALVTLGDTIKVSNFWINNTLKVTGDYTPKSKKGAFTLYAKKFHIKDKVAEMDTGIDIKAALDGNNTTVEGKIVLLGGKITPEMKTGRSFATDSDIVVLQEMKKKRKSPFMQNLALALQIETKKPLRLKQGPVNIRLKPDFAINKERGGELLYLGSVELMKGGTYIFQKKRFVLGKSFVYFTGDVNKPLLDMKANYQSINYLVTISISGTPVEPNITFSSTPSLTREQILSVILFDSEAGGDTHSGTEMMKMMGGAMAKAALSDVGIDVDHLAFGEGNSVEVGKKLNSKTTVIYINGDIPKVKLKYRHSKHTESVIGVSEQSQSYDIIYKRDF